MKRFPTNQARGRVAHQAHEQTLEDRLDGVNISEFCRTHKLPLRTVMRIKAGGKPRIGTAMLIELALRKAGL